jgi:hypothetical protein
VRKTSREHNFAPYIVYDVSADQGAGHVRGSQPVRVIAKETTQHMAERLTHLIRGEEQEDNTSSGWIGRVSAIDGGGMEPRILSTIELTTKLDHAVHPSEGAAGNKH